MTSKTPVRERRVFVSESDDWQQCALVEEVENGEVVHYVDVLRSVQSGGRVWKAARYSAAHGEDLDPLDTLTIEFEEAVTTERAVRRVLEEWPWCNAVNGTGVQWEA